MGRMSLLEASNFEQITSHSFECLQLQCNFKTYYATIYDKTQLPNLTFMCDEIPIISSVDIQSRTYHCNEPLLTLHLTILTKQIRFFSVALPILPNQSV